jgi:hypothetical protein
MTSACKVYSHDEQKQFECPHCRGHVSQLTDSYSFQCDGDRRGKPWEWGCGWFGFAVTKVTPPEGGLSSNVRSSK